MTPLSRMRLLVIGGSGFLSGTLARRAVARGHQVWTVTRGQRPLPEGVTGIIAERRDRAGFAAALAGAGVSWDLAVDCIAFTPDDIALDLAALAGRAAHLVFVSTDFVYDPAHRRVPQGEQAERYLSEGYGGLKRQAELVLERSGGELPWTTVRPCHIYGPGSQLGCLPLHGRDPRLIERLRAGEPLRLVGGGHFLQQPVLARDLADLFLSLAGNPATYRQTFCAAGPEIVESRAYYQLVADALGVPLAVEEVPVSAHLREHPEAAPFLSHRVYDMAKLRASGAAVPSTPLADGLREQVASLLGA